MSGLHELIVIFLFFPVSMYILLPLVMLAGWSVMKLAGRITGITNKNVQPTEYQTLEPGHTME